MSLREVPRRGPRGVRPGDPGQGRLSPGRALEERPPARWAALLVRRQSLQARHSLGLLGAPPGHEYGAREGQCFEEESLHQENERTRLLHRRKEPRGNVA